MKYIFILVVLLLYANTNSAQNVLSAVYVNIPLVIGKDTLYSYFEGLVIDSATHCLISNTKVELFSSRGDALSTKTDAIGYFRFSSLPSNSKIKVICSSDSVYMKREWSFDTNGMGNLIRLNTILMLNRK